MEGIKVYNFNESNLLEETKLDPKYVDELISGKDDLKTLFEKYAPFNMQVKYERTSTPVLWRVEKLEPKDFLQFFKDFRKASDECYPLFYMFTVSAKEWYDGFYIEGADC